MTNFSRATAVCIIALLLSAWSMATFIIEVLTIPSRLLAEHLERLPLPRRTDVDDLRDIFDVEPALTVCSREMVRSAISIELIAFDVAWRNGQAASALLAWSRARNLLEIGLRCFPQEGNLWVRLAALEAIYDPLSPSIQEMLILSAKNAPNEA